MKQLCDKCKVEPIDLEWEKTYIDYFETINIPIKYTVSRNYRGSYGVCLFEVSLTEITETNEKELGNFDTIEQAKEFAQNHFNKLVMELLK